MVAQIQSRTGFTGFGKQISTPNLPLPYGTNSMIVVILSGLNNLSPDNTVFKSPASVGTNQPAQAVTDNMGNAYYRVNTVNNNSLLMNPLLYEEIWIANINNPILRNIVVTAVYPATTLCVGEVIVVTPQNPQNQLAVDNAILEADNVNNVFGSVGQGSSQPTGELVTPAAANELLILGINYVFNNQPPTTPPTAPAINGIGPSSVIDNNSLVGVFTNPMLTPGTTYGFGLAIISQLASGATTINWNITSQGASVASWITLILAIQEVAIAQPSIQEPIMSAAISPESVALVATPVAGLTVMKLPVGS